MDLGRAYDETYVSKTPPRTSQVPNPGTRRNSERTGQRKLTRLSKVARTVDNVRHVDVDLLQYCAACKNPEAVFEVKSKPVSVWEWEQVRRLAGHFGHGCIAALVIETWYGDIGISIYDTRTGEIDGVRWSGDEQALVKVMEDARDRHECWTVVDQIQS